MMGTRRAETLLCDCPAKVVVESSNQDFTKGPNRHSLADLLKAVSWVALFLAVSVQFGSIVGFLLLVILSVVVFRAAICRIDFGDK